MKLSSILMGGAIVLAGLGSAAAQDTRIHFINCGDDQGGGNAVHTRLIAEWEADNPGYKVDREFVPWGQCQEKSTTLASAGDAPALAYMGSRTLKQLSANGLIVEIPMTDAEKATYAAPVLGTITANGKVWGSPIAFSTKALYWNKDLFAEAGLLPDSPPTTWADWLTAATAINEKTDANGMGIAAASFDNTMHQFMNYVYTNGGEVINSDGEIVFNSPNNVEALEMYAALAKVAEPGPIAYDRGKLRPLFIEGTIGMMISGPWERGLIGDVNWGVAPIPVGPHGTPGTLLITDSLAVFSGTGVEEQALSLTKWLTSPDHQLEFELASGLTPLRDMPGVAAIREEDPTWNAFLDAIATGGPEPFVTDYVGLQDAINEAIQSVILEEATAEDAIADAADLLEDYK